MFFTIPIIILVFLTLGNKAEPRTPFRFRGGGVGGVVGGIGHPHNRPITHGLDPLPTTHNEEVATIPSVENHDLHDLPLPSSSSDHAPLSPRQVDVAALLKNINSLVGGAISGALSQIDQNGLSTWGTTLAPTLPNFANWTGKGLPWGGISTSNSDPYVSAPNTGNVRTYSLTLANCAIAPDGVATQRAVCVNGQFPGPLIEANYGDTVVVKVTNRLTEEGTAIHWHGFLQTKNAANDGVPGVTQCPIPPGQSYTYTFRAELYGSSWYHAHLSAQYAAGAWGPLVVYGPSNSGYDIDLGPVMLSEWYRGDYMQTVRNLMRPLKQGGPILPLANSNLINGKMRFPCEKTTAPCKQGNFAQFNFTSGKNHRLRLVNSGSGAIQKFSIDGHTMQVIANDYMPLKPYNASVIALGVGQRADVVVFGSGKKGDKYWMRSNIVTCSLNDGALTEARAVIYYDGADRRTLPAAPANSGPAASTSVMSCANDPLANTEPSFPLAAANPDVTQTLNITLQSNGTNMLLYFGNNSFRADFSDPLLSRAVWNNISTVNKQRNVWNIGFAKVARAVIYNYDAAPHPIHLHGHNMQILNIGMGKWDGTIVRSNNPQRRDVQVMPPAISDKVPSFLVIQWDANNPGVWPLHCHFAWHSSLGLVVNVVEQTSSTILPLLSSVIKFVSPNCVNWANWLKPLGSLSTGIDSGLRRRNEDESAEGLDWIY